jgi:hypothetical protein
MAKSPSVESGGETTCHSARPCPPPGILKITGSHVQNVTFPFRWVFHKDECK